MDKKKREILWLVVSIIIFGYFLIELNENSCVTNTEIREVRGNSLFGLINAGQTIKILYGYYNCNPVQRGDAIVYNYAGSSNPIIKIVRGIPGDRFAVVPSNSETTEQSIRDNKYQIVINGHLLSNTDNQPFLLTDLESRMLQFYAKDYQGKIPPDTYLILGNITSGSLDSTRFGLVGKNDILGKALW